MESLQENLEDFLNNEELADSFLIEKYEDQFINKELHDSLLIDEYLNGLTAEELIDISNSPLSLELNPHLKALSAKEIHQKIIAEQAKRFESNIKNTTWPFENEDK